MQSTSFDAYQQLKKAIAQKFCEAHPEYPQDLSEWKGKLIATFQEELIRTVNGRVSEKWFYTHLKPKQIQKLPRTDMLDLLSRFVGYENWQIFQETYAQEKIESSPKKWKVSQRIIAVLLFVLIGIGGFAFQSFLGISQSHTYQACLIDAYLQQPIQAENIEVFWLKAQESPMQIACDSNACFEITTQAKEIKLVLQASYYKSDTIVRKLGQSDFQEKLRLMPDDYALMIHYFANSKVTDWKKRQAQLHEIFAENARVFQVDTNGTGMELYDKTDFIQKLTMPINSLKNIRILSTEYDAEGKILYLRFIQTE